MIAYLNRITDHGGLTGLSDDDHTLYFKADGSRNLTGNLVTSGQGIRPVANSTTAIQIQQANGTAFVNFDATNKRVGINNIAPIYPLQSTVGNSTWGFAVTHTTGYGTLGIYMNSTGNPDIRITNSSNNTAMILSPNAGDSSYINAGNFGIKTASPTKDFAIGGNLARTIWLERHTTAATAGNNLTIQAGAPKASESNLAGGTLYLSGAISTGTGESGVELQTATAGVSGSGDNSATTKFKVFGNKIAFFGGTPVIQQVLAAYTSDAESGAYTGIDNAQVGSVYAQVADLNTLRVAYDNLRASFDDLRTKLVTSTFMATA